MFATRISILPRIHGSISKLTVLSAVLTLGCLASVASAQQRPRPAGPGEIRLLEDPIDESTTWEPDKSSRFGIATSKGGGTDVWDAAKSAGYLAMVKAGKKDIVSITGQDPVGGYLWYRRVLGTEITANGDGETVLAVRLGREYMKYVGPWDPDNGEQPKHPFLVK